MSAPTATAIAETWQAIGAALRSHALDRGAVALIWQMVQVGRPLSEREIVQRTTRGPWPNGAGEGPPELQRWNLLGMIAGRHAVPTALLAVLWQDLQDNPAPAAFDFHAWLKLRAVSLAPAGDALPKRTGTRNPIPRAVRRANRRRGA